MAHLTKDTPKTQSRIPRVLLVDPDPQAADQIRVALADMGCEILHVRTGDEACARTAGIPPDLIITEAVLPDMDGYNLVRTLRRSEPSPVLQMLMLTGKSEVSDRLAGFEAGVNDFMIKPFEPQELAYRVKSLLGNSRLAASAGLQVKKRGTIIAVFGTKGGVGKTTLAVNLSVALKRLTKASLVLVDADFAFGDVPLYLKLVPTTTIMDLVKRIDQLEPELIERVLVSHSSGIRVLLGPTQPEEAEDVSAAHLEKLLDALANLYTYVVVDCHPDYNDRNLQILEQADQIMFVVRPELGPLRNMGVFLNLVHKLGMPLRKVHIVLNRAGTKSGIEIEQIERSFKSRVEFRLMSGGRTVITCMNRGVPIVIDKQNHKLSRQIMGIAEYLARLSPAGGLDRQR